MRGLIDVFQHQCIVSGHLSEELLTLLIQPGVKTFYHPFCTKLKHSSPALWQVMLCVFRKDPLASAHGWSPMQG